MTKAKVTLFLFITILILNGCGGDNPVTPPPPVPPEDETPDTPSLVSPSNNSDDHPSILSLEWEEVKDAKSYSLQISTDSDFSNLFLDENGIQTPSKLIEDLELDQKYFWKVKSVNEKGESDWSTTWSFTIQQLIETSENTKLLSPDLAVTIADTAEGLNVISFESNSKYANNLSVGDIIMSSSNDMLPNGALRKVVAINNSGGMIEVSTEQAVLEEALESVDLSYEIPISRGEKTKFISNVQGVSTKNKVRDLELFTAVFDTAVIYEQITNGIKEKIYLTGDVNFKATLIVDLKIKDSFSGIERMTFAIKTDFDSNLKLGASLSKEIKKSKKVGEFDKLPTIAIGPLVLKPELDIYIGAEGKITAGAEFGVNYNSSITAGLQYIEPNWQTIEDNSQEFGFDTPSFYGFKVDANAKGFAEGRYQSLLYGVAGPEVTPRVFIEGNLNSSMDPWWSFYAGVEAEAGVVLEVLWKELARYSRSGLIGLKIKIADSNTFGPKLDWSLSSSIAPSEATSEVLSITNGGSGDLEWSINNTSEWLEVTPLNGSGNTEVTLNFSENSTFEDRKTQIEIESNGGYSGPIAITQEGQIKVDELTASYPFSGNAIDETGNGYDGTVNGATLTTDRFGSPNSAYSFDGNDDIRIGDHFEFQQFSFSAWINTSSSGQFEKILSKTREGTGYENKQIKFMKTDNDQLRLAIYDSNNLAQATSSSKINTGSWLHCVGIFDKGTVSVYVDGILEESISSTVAMQDGTLDFMIGNDADNASPWKGIIDDVKIFNYVIPESKISELYSEGGYEHPTKEIVSWGLDNYGQSTVPSDLSNVKNISAGGYHNLALLENGTVVAWGNNERGQSTVPDGLSNVIAVASGDAHSLAMKSDGTVVAWGDNRYGQLNLPEGLANVKAISAGGHHSLALLDDGTLVAWGSNDRGQNNVPSDLNNVKSIASGYRFNIALLEDGNLVAWGNDNYGQSSVPNGLNDVISISAGYDHSLALLTDGTVVAWGNNEYNKITIPEGLNNVTAVSGGYRHSLALLQDGTVIAWGSDQNGRSTVPTDLTDITSISAGGGHNIAKR